MARGQTQTAVPLVSTSFQKSLYCTPAFVSDRPWEGGDQSQGPPLGPVVVEGVREVDADGEPEVLQGMPVRVLVRRPTGGVGGGVAPEHVAEEVEPQPPPPAAVR